MSQEELEIVISPTGEVKVNVMGAQGQECLDISKFLEEALGDVKDRKFKSEYYQSNQIKPTGYNTLKNQQY